MVGNKKTLVGTKYLKICASVLIIHINIIDEKVLMAFFLVLAPARENPFSTRQRQYVHQSINTGNKPSL
ncbi:MAG: hypothetical protein DRR19_16435 [Candidatus Parabeggiatoa sp. nov. 1]|nr:MAG: hypothetical protein DRR19_16435 [Gammaproteobacteria bacterium]